MRHFQRTLVSTAIALALAASGTAAAQFSNVYFFGDSLTDMGSSSRCCRRAPGCSRPIPVRSGRSRSRSTSASPPAPPIRAATTTPTAARAWRCCQAYPTRRPDGRSRADRDADPAVARQGPARPERHLFRSGAARNDFFTQFAALHGGQDHLRPGAGQPCARGAPNWCSRSACCSAAGAQYILVWNYPTSARRRTYAGNPAAGQIDALVNRSSIRRCTAALDAAGIPTIRVNAQALVNEVVANPAAYGFANVTERLPAARPPSLLCTSANLVAPNAASTYFFADGVHPTTAGHAIFAQLRDVDDRRPAADGRARRSPARGRAGELPRARRPDVVEPQRAAQPGKLEALGRLRLRPHATCRPARTTAAPTRTRSRSAAT